jgi:peptidyl-prolyl cis-trans isomerase B (cyclophilin B)
VPKATKRERQRQNREARRDAMLAEEKRRRRFKLVRNLVIIVVAVVAAAALYSLTQDDDDSTESASEASAASCSTRQPDSPPSEAQFAAAPEMTIDPATTYEVVMSTSCGEIPITLDAQRAPQTVNSFLFLSDEGFYDGTTFHRVVKDFVNQGGDPSGTGDGGPGYSLPDEPPTGAYQVGDVAMANRGPGTTGSQFFLVVSEQGAAELTAESTPGRYSILGRMSPEGLKVARKINSFAQPDPKPSRDLYVFSVDVTSSTTTTTAAS